MKSIPSDDPFSYTGRAVPPSFTKTLKKQNANIGNDITMECKFCGTQPIDVCWYRDDKEIHSDAKYNVEAKDNMAVLLIRSLGLSDGGNYRCRLTNVAGQKDDTGTLCVKGQKSCIQIPLVSVGTERSILTIS